MNSEFLITVATTEIRVRILGDGRAEINGKERRFDLRSAGPGSYSLMVGNDVFDIGMVESNGSPDNDSGLECVVSVDGRAFDLRVDDRRSLLLKSLLKNQSHHHGSSLVRAPMPGLIVKLSISQGSDVKTGQGTVILEAMKMENEIRALHSGRVEQIFVKAGQAVEKGEPLFSVVQD